MSVLVVARNDLRGVTRERGTWTLAGGFLLVFGGLAGLLVSLDAPDFESYLDLLAAGVGLLVPLVGVVVGYETVVGERESGTAVLTLSLPHSRTALALGTLLGRSVLYVGTLLGAAALAGVAVAVTFPNFEAVRYLSFVLLAAVYGLVYLWVAGGLSMALASSRRVIVAGFGAYLGLTLFYTVAIDLVVVVLYRFRPGALVAPDSWVVASKFLGPRTAYSHLAGSLGAGGVPPVTAGATEWFVTAELALLALAGWGVVPVVLGVLRFRRAEL